MTDDGIPPDLAMHLLALHWNRLVLNEDSR